MVIGGRMLEMLRRSRAVRGAEVEAPRFRVVWGTIAAWLKICSRTTPLPGEFTTLGSFAEQADALPNDIGKMAHAVQMLVLHRFWAQAYQVDVTPERDKEQGLHGAEAMLAQAMTLGPARIGEVRLPKARVIGNCRHFSTMLCAFLRHKGIASARTLRLLDVLRARQVRRSLGLRVLER